MITKDELNEDQLKSFDQITMEAGETEEKALELIQELCIDKGFTGLRIAARYVLSPEGRKAAIDLLPELRAVETSNN